ncbi:MAG: hypothetical protein CL666_11715 [Balneola sp.]|nr:hypothetical protein [Balneola sp.]|tara:strand:- start:29481 stop:30527 length:1047 start_codon:yes stop_codon:yes gene_type:complete
MVNNRTVIVLGAGGSKEFDLPIGNELIEEIGDLLKFRPGYHQVSDDLIDKAFRVYSSNNRETRKKLDEASLAITHALPLTISIDNLIDAHRGNKEIEVCSKMAIVRAILNAERRSQLFIDKSKRGKKLNFEDTKNTWLNLLFKIITENATIEDITERLSNFVFVVFNYDRCLEHFLYHAFQSYYNVSANVAIDLLAHLNVHHMYGKVGELPWIDYNSSIDFGEEPTPHKLVKLINEIKTFTENKDEEKDELEAIHRHIESAKNMIFLGFAYHKLNMELLALDGREHSDLNSTRYYGTAYQISDSNTDEIIRQLSKIGGLDRSRINIHNKLTCYELFNEYWRTFSLTNM